MAFMSHDDYLKTFGGALQKAAMGGQQDQFGPPPGAAPQPAPAQPAQGGAFMGPPAQVAPMGPPASGAFTGPPEQPIGEIPLNHIREPGKVAPGAFGDASAWPQPQAAKPAIASPPAGEAPKGEEKPAGKPVTMKTLLEEASPEETEQFVAEMEKQVGGDLIAAAAPVVAKDPEMASKYASLVPGGKWDKAEAAALMMEFGLRMMQAGASGEGNFLGDVGSSGLGALDSRRAFKREEEGRLQREKDAEFQRKQRERDEGNWEMQDREARRENKRRSAEELRRQTGEEREAAEEIRRKEAHDKGMLKGEWTQIVGDDGNVTFVDPNTKAQYSTGIKAGARDASGKISAFSEQLAVWQESRAGGAEVWKTLSPAEQSRINAEFFDYQKSGVNKDQYRQQALSRMITENQKLPKHRQQTQEEMQAAIDAAFPPEQGTNALSGVTPGWAD